MILLATVDIRENVMNIIIIELNVLHNYVQRNY